MALDHTIVNLSHTWSETGVKVPVTVAKYKLGWEVEIPTFENFNHILFGMDTNIKYSATHAAFEWQPDLDYSNRAVVLRNGKTYTNTVADSPAFAGQPATGNLNTDPTTGNGWTEGAQFGTFNKFILGVGSIPIQLSKALGVLIGNIQTGAVNTWHSNKITTGGANAMIALNTEHTAYKNWAIGNVKGELVAVDTSGSTEPNGMDIAADGANSPDQSASPTVFKLLHSGNAPEVDGEVLPLPDTVVKRTQNGNIQAGALQVQMLETNQTPTHVAVFTSNVNTGGITELKSVPVSSIGGAGGGFPIGGIVAMAGGSYPAVGAWITCSGQSLPRSSYTALSAVMPSGYGGSSSATIKVPNLTSRVIKGGTSSNINSFTPSSLPSHNHTYLATSANAVSLRASGGVAQFRHAPSTNWYNNVSTGYTGSGSKVEMDSVSLRYFIRIA